MQEVSEYINMADLHTRKMWTELDGFNAFTKAFTNTKANPTRYASFNKSRHHCHEHQLKPLLVWFQRDCNITAYVTQ